MTAPLTSLFAAASLLAIGSLSSSQLLHSVDVGYKTRSCKRCCFRTEWSLKTKVMKNLAARKVWPYIRNLLQSCPPPSSGDSRRLLTFLAVLRAGKSLPRASLVKLRATEAASGDDFVTFALKILANFVQKMWRRRLRRRRRARSSCPP